MAAELGVDIEELARSAFEGYMDGVRAARLGDFDGPPAGSSNISSLPLRENHRLTRGHRRLDQHRVAS